MIDMMEGVFNNKFIHRFRIGLYMGLVVYVIACFAMSTSLEVDERMQFWELLVVSGACILLGVHEWYILKYPDAAMKHRKLGYAFQLVRVFVMTAIFYYWEDSPVAFNVIFMGMIVFSSIEAFLYVAYDETSSRVGFYLSYFVVYEMTAVFIRMIHGSLPSGLGGVLRESSTAVVLTLVPVIVGEALSTLYDQVFKEIMAQKRKLSELEGVNEELKQHQERMKKVNDVLGMQKIELQTANKKINRSHDEMSVQNEVSSAIATSKDKEPLMRRIVDILQIRLDMDAVIIILEPDNSIVIPGVEPKGRFLAIATNLGDEFTSQIERSVYETDLKEMLVMSKLYMQNTSTESVRFFQYLDDEKFDIPSVICIPITGSDERYGTLIVMKNKINVFMDGAAFYSNIAGQISLGVANAMLYEKMEDMAIRDGLTRIYNRGHLNEILNDYLSEGMKTKQTVTMALFDIDKFKMINDEYGHQCGDEAIKYVASLLNIAAVRNGGIAGRYGGEEFVIAFLGKSVDEVYEIVKDVHTKIREGEVHFTDKVVKVRVSAGISSYPETCENPTDILTRADWAMYTSKQNGRDRITIDSDDIKNMM